MQDLITAASASATAPVVSATEDALTGADLGEIFGIEMESTPASVPAKAAKPRVAKPKKAPASGKKPLPKKLAKPAGKAAPEKRKSGKKVPTGKR